MDDLAIKIEVERYHRQESNGNSDIINTGDCGVNVEEEKLRKWCELFMAPLYRRSFDESR